jgi:uncharacterized protein
VSTTERFAKRTRIQAPAELVMAWHERPGALERILPPWEFLRIVDWDRSLVDGARAVFTVSIGGLPRRWVADHFDYIPGRQFCDVQPVGPFAYWRYIHKADPDGPDACFYEDDIEYRLPFGYPGRLLGGGYVRRRLERIYAYRHAIVKHDNLLHARFSQQPLKILVSGWSGLLGSPLVHFLSAGGHSISVLTRDTGGTYAKVIPWNPKEGAIPLERLEGFDAIVHLDGELGHSTRSADRKNSSRREPLRDTELLCQALAKLAAPPRVLICGSSLASYGDRGSTELAESAVPGEGFPSEPQYAREQLTESLRDRGIRVAHLRFGSILTWAGGMLRRRLLPHRLGLGYVLGAGDQYRSWVTLDDALGAVLHVIGSDEISGPVIVSAPNPVRERELSEILARSLRRPAPLRIPKSFARILQGGEIERSPSASTRAQPAKLLATDYLFRNPDLDSALRHLLGIRESSSRRT